jgi:catechol 2,3-dioxygenase
VGTGQPPFAIVRAGHAELRVTDLGAALAFYVDLLGFVVTEEDRGGGRVYLRGYEDAVHHSLVLRRASAPGAGHLAFRVADPDDVERAARYFADRGCPVRRLRPDEEAGQEEAVRVQDPLGFPVEFYAAMAPAERLLRRFDLYRGAMPMRLDHFNLHVPDAAAADRYYRQELGFRCSEYTDADGAIWASWLHRKDNVHDVAVMNGTGPRLHHLGFTVAEPASVIRACDVLAGAGRAAAIERGPGRHGISNAFFLYLRDPDGNRIELYAGDYLTADPDTPPLRWDIDDPRRQTFWGHAAPASWFDEAMLVEDVATGALRTPQSPRLRDRPDMAH